jgi:hypothetical protein
LDRQQGFCGYTGLRATLIWVLKHVISARVFVYVFLGYGALKRSLTVPGNIFVAFVWFVSRWAFFFPALVLLGHCYGLAEMG